MRLISQSGLEESVNVPYDRVTIKLQKTLVTTDGSYEYRIIADDTGGVYMHTLGRYSNREEAEYVFARIYEALFEAERDRRPGVFFMDDPYGSPQDAT